MTDDTGSLETGSTASVASSTRRERFDDRRPGRQRSRRRTWRFSVGNVLGCTFSVWFQNLPTFFVLTALIFAPYVAYVCYLHLADVTMSPAVWRVSTQVLSSLCGFVLDAALVFGVFQKLRGRRTSFGTLLAQGLTRVPPVIGVVVVMALLIGGACIPWFALTLLGGPFAVFGMLGIWISIAILSTAFYVAVPVAVVERRGLSALRRSWELTRGCRLAVFVVLVLLALIQVVGGAVVGGFSSVVLEEEQAVWIAPLIVVLVSSSLSAVAQAVVYHDLRIGVEGSTTEELAAIFD